MKVRARELGVNFLKISSFSSTVFGWNKACFCVSCFSNMNLANCFLSFLGNVMEVFALAKYNFI